MPYINMLAEAGKQKGAGTADFEGFGPGGPHPSLRMRGSDGDVRTP